MILFVFEVHVSVCPLFLEHHQPLLFLQFGSTISCIILQVFILMLPPLILAEPPLIVSVFIIILSQMQEIATCQ